MVEIKHLSFRYRKKKDLFLDLNLTLGSGCIYGLLGKNGAGKTTLLKIISGLLFPKDGKCGVFGIEARLRSPEVLKEICFIPEEFYVPAIPVNLFVKLYAPFYPRFSRERFDRYLHEFDITGEGPLLSSMSYGQKKKFLIAFGLATDCSLFILDEPTNGLDIPSKSQFRKLLAASLSDDRSFIISTHQVRDMEKLIDPIIIVEDGEIIFNKFTSEISEKLTVQVQSQEPDDEEALYYEKVLGGYAVISENTGHRETQIDLELLFNAIIKNKDRIGRIFSIKEAVT